MKVVGYTALEGYFARPTGVGKHIDQMFHGLAQAPGVDFSVLTARNQVAPDGKPSAGHPLADLPVVLLPFARRQIEWRWLLTNRPFIDRWIEPADWIYAPYEVNVMTRRSRRAVTIHSLYVFDPENPQYHTRQGWMGRLRFGSLFKRVIQHSELLLTVSQYVRRQIVEWYRVKEEKIVVVGNGVEPEFFAAGDRPAAPRRGRPYVVCVSGLNELDGAPYVLAVARELLRKDPDIEIRIAGHQHEPKYLAQHAELPNIRLLGYVPRHDLATLMHDSVALLFLNRYESFGIAAAEAMAAGTPVIGTGFTAVPEIVAGAGLSVDANRPGEIAEQIIHLARTDSARQTLIGQGVRRARDFTWRACVDRLLAGLTDASASQTRY